MRPDLILCLGNEILTDDGFGPAVAKRLTEKLDARCPADVVYAPLAGFALLDLLRERQRVLVVDTIRTGKALPGTINLFEAGAFTPSEHLISSHQISLPTALALGNELDMSMPEDIQVLAVEAKDVETLSEQMTTEVEAAVETALLKIEDWLKIQQEVQYGTNRETTGHIST